MQLVLYNRISTDFNKICFEQSILLKMRLKRLKIKKSPSTCTGIQKIKSSKINDSSIN